MAGGQGCRSPTWHSVQPSSHHLCEQGHLHIYLSVNDPRFGSRLECRGAPPTSWCASEGDWSEMTPVNSPKSAHLSEQEQGKTALPLRFPGTSHVAERCLRRNSLRDCYGYSCLQALSRYMQPPMCLPRPASWQVRHSLQWSLCGKLRGQSTISACHGSVMF